MSKVGPEELATIADRLDTGASGHEYRVALNLREAARKIRVAVRRLGEPA